VESAVVPIRIRFQRCSSTTPLPDSSVAGAEVYLRTRLKSFRQNECWCFSYCLSSLLRVRRRFLNGKAMSLTILDYYSRGCDGRETLNVPTSGRSQMGLRCGGVSEEGKVEGDVSPLFTDLRNTTGERRQHIDGRGYKCSWDWEMEHRNISSKSSVGKSLITVGRRWEGLERARGQLGW